MIINDKDFIAKKIKVHRKKAGLTQAELAEKIDISTLHLSRIENANYLPSLGTFFKIVEVLKININEFGINSNDEEIVDRDNILRIIYSATDAELRFYEKVLVAISSELPKLKNTP